MWHRIGVVLAGLSVGAMVIGIWIATGSAGAVQIDGANKNCGSVVLEWTPFANEEPESGACGHLAAGAMNRAVVLFLGGALVLTTVVGAGLVLVRPPEDE